MLHSSVIMSFLNKTSCEDWVTNDCYEIQNDNFISIYLKTMLNRTSKSLALKVNSEIVNKYQDEVSQCKKLVHMLKRERHVFRMTEELRILEEKCTSLLSISDSSDTVMNVLNTLKDSLEKVLNQLHMRGFPMLSNSQKLNLVRVLGEIDKLLKTHAAHFNEDLTEKSVLAQTLSNTVECDLKERKEKCYSLMKATSNLTIKMSADTAAKSSHMILKSNHI